MIRRPFTVIGEGFFPVDMLRYDNCEYASEYERKIAETQSHRRRVTLVTVGRNTPSKDRWKSFGWRLMNPGER